MVRALGDQDRFRAQCGLPLATYFSGPKLRWLLDHVPGARAKAERGEILFGTMDSWLIWKLTGQHVTDVTNASRTMLMNLATLDWDDDAALRHRRAARDAAGDPSVHGRSMARRWARSRACKVAGALGDQQAALFGQTCFAPGEAKCTYGTGNFLLLNTGETPIQSKNGLLTTLGYQIAGRTPVYALEGSIAVTGSLVQWVRDNLGLIKSAPRDRSAGGQRAGQWRLLFRAGVCGLFAPYWRADARGVIAGLTGYVTKAHIARAVLEATAWQTREVVDAMAADSGVALTTLKVDGGMTANNLLMQFQADVLGAPVVRPTIAETTCLGAAYAAGIAVGLWPSPESLRANWKKSAEWTPALAADARETAYGQWKKAVQRTLGWVEP